MRFALTTMRNMDSPAGRWPTSGSGFGPPPPPLLLPAASSRGWWKAIAYAPALQGMHVDFFKQKRIEFLF